MRANEALEAMQGMNYVAAVLLLLLNGDNHTEHKSESPDEIAFWMLYALVRNRGMADIWRDKMPGFVCARE